MPKYVSEILYHLVGSKSPDNHEFNFDVLCKVIESQEVRHRRIDDTGSSVALSIDFSRVMSNGELIDQSVTCFCDIERDSLSPIHTAKYGLFGVGVDRQIFAEWGGRPVFYIPLVRRNLTSWSNRFGKEVLTILQALQHYFPSEWIEKTTSKGNDWFPESSQDAVEAADTLISRDLLAFLKFFEVSLPDSDINNFYMEREWRKFGPFPLHMSLREVVVAKGYARRLSERFPRLAVPIHEI